MKWISVEDEMPPFFEHVLVFGDDGVFTAYTHNPKHPMWNCHPTGTYASDALVYGITHWMPLPKAPGGIMNEEKYIINQWTGYDKIHVDPILKEIFKIAFDYTNECGLKGIKVSDFEIKTRNKNPEDPIDNDMWFAKCRKYVSLEEYERVVIETNERWDRWINEELE